MLLLFVRLRPEFSRSVHESNFPPWNLPLRLISTWNNSPIGTVLQRSESFHETNSNFPPKTNLYSLFHFQPKLGEGQNKVSITTRATHLPVGLVVGLSNYIVSYEILFQAAWLISTTRKTCLLTPKKTTLKGERCPVLCMTQSFGTEKCTRIMFTNTTRCWKKKERK